MVAPLNTGGALAPPGVGSARAPVIVPIGQTLTYGYKYLAYN